MSAFIVIPANVLLDGLDAYANFGHESASGTWKPNSHTPPIRYGEIARTWSRLGARLIGGCCGTTPEHIRALRECVQSL